MFINNHLPSRLEQSKQLFRHFRRLRYGAQHLHTGDSIHTPRPESILPKFLQVFYPARNDGVHIAEPVFLDFAPQSFMQVDIRLNAVDAVDLRDVVTGQLIAAPGTYFEDCAIGFRDEFGDISLLLTGGD